MKLWINNDFLFMWIGQFVSQIGDKIYSIALAWWLLQKTNSPSCMGLFLVCSILPEMVLGPVAGGFIDKWNRKAIVIVADISRGAVVLAIAALSMAHDLEIWQIFIAAIAISLASAFFNATVLAIIPAIVDTKEITRANSLSELITGVTTIIGPVLGASFVSLMGYTSLFFINAVSYLISALSESFMTIPSTNSCKPEDKLIQSVKVGLKFILTNRLIYIILIVIAVVHIFFGSLTVTMPFLAKTLAGKGITNLSFLEATIGGGMLAGAIVVHQSKFFTINSLSLFIAIVVMGGCFVFTGIARGLGINSVLPYMALMFLTGMAVTAASIYWRSLLQINVPGEMAGRVFGIASTVANISYPLSLLVFGVLLNYLPMALLLLFSGICLVVISLLGVTKRTQTQMGEITGSAQLSDVERSGRCVPQGPESP